MPVCAATQEATMYGQRFAENPSRRMAAPLSGNTQTAPVAAPTMIDNEKDGDLSYISAATTSFEETAIEVRDNSLFHLIFVFLLQSVIHRANSRL